MHASSPKKSSKRARRGTGFGILVSSRGGSIASIVDIYTDNNNDFLDTLAKLFRYCGPSYLQMKLPWLLTLPLIRCDKIIQNINVPSCRNCMYYKPNIYNDFSSSLNRCEKFGTKDIVTDEIHYDFADFCRKDEERCGKDGKYFVIEENLPAKMATHFVVKNWPIGFAITIAVLLNALAAYSNLNP